VHSDGQDVVVVQNSPAKVRKVEHSPVAKPLAKDKTTAPGPIITKDKALANTTAPGSINKDKTLANTGPIIMKDKTLANTAAPGPIIKDKRKHTNTAAPGSNILDKRDHANTAAPCFIVDKSKLEPLMPGSIVLDKTQHVNTAAPGSILDKAQHANTAHGSIMDKTQHANTAHGSIMDKTQHADTAQTVVEKPFKTFSKPLKRFLTGLGGTIEVDSPPNKVRREAKPAMPTSSSSTDKKPAMPTSRSSTNTKKPAMPTSRSSSMPRSSRYSPDKKLKRVALTAENLSRHDEITRERFFSQSRWDLDDKI